MRIHRDTTYDLRPAFTWAMAELFHASQRAGHAATGEDSTMNTRGELTTYLETWNREAQRTLDLLATLPPGQYDFRPDPAGRSIGELAWHLGEIDACLSFGIEHRRFRIEDEPPGLARPRTIEQLAPGYRRVHDEAVARLATLEDDDLDERITYFDGRPMTIREVLRGALLDHLVHHRGQLVLLCRMAGGRPPGLFGPNREQMAEIRARMQAT